jgi:putative transposase
MMLDRTQITELFDHLGTPGAGRELILKARTLAPVRDVKSRGGNVITMLASRKMGREIYTESRHIEFAAAINHEYDHRVIEYYAQPCELKLELIDETTGNIRNIRHFPDYLVICEDSFTLEEWKSAQKLARLAEKYPYRYQRDSEGGWYSPQIEEQLAKLGIRYRIFSDESIPRRRVENFLHLADYFHPAADPVPEYELIRLNLALREHGALYFNELCAAPFGFTADNLNKAIADNLVVADLDRETLTNIRRCRLYRDVTLREFMAGEVKLDAVPGIQNFALDIAEGAKFLYEHQELIMLLVGEREVVCAKQDGSTINLQRDWLKDAHEKGRISPVLTSGSATLDLSQYSEAELKEALRRQSILMSGTTSAKFSDRTVRRMIAKQQTAMANGGHEVLALVPQISKRGNRTVRLSEQQLEQLKNVMETHWKSNEAKNYRDCHRELRIACIDAGIAIPSYPTLIGYIKAQETNADVRTRHGKRMAYQQDTYIDVLYHDTPPHGSRPFQYVHIDHTQIDIEHVSSRTGKPIGRPWLTLAIDAWSRRIVAFYLTFDPPSYRSVMMVIRDMVQRFQRLPEFIIVDNGKEFLSEAFETFLKAMGTHLRYRPAGRPRHGAVLERLFGRAHSEYIHNLAGNTKATKNVRMTTGKHLPVNFATWTLEAMYFGFQHWATEYYETERHPALDDTPRETYLRGLRESGSRPQRQILLNRDFLISTCPPADRTGIRQVHRQNGVKVNNQFFWSPEFSDSRIAGQQFSVRYDPWDASSVYVRVKERWIQAICRNLIGLGQLTELERRALTEEYTHRSGGPVDEEKAAQRLREFLQTFTPEGALAIEMERQAENKSLYRTLQLGCITPVAPLKKFSLIQETSSPTQSTVDNRSSKSPIPSGSLHEATAPDTLPDFDVF